MKKFLIFAVIAAVVFACGGSGETPEKKANKSSEKTVAEAAKPKIDGAKIYKQYCIACHGLYGDMGASGAYNLTESKLTLEEKIAVITNGRNTMTPFKDLLSEEQIKAVAQHTVSLKSEE